VDSSLLAVAGRRRSVHVASPSVGHLECEVAAPKGLDTPVLLVQEMMVIPTQQDEIVEVGSAAIAPPDDVVQLASVGGDGTARDYTPAVQPP
jgi:hypothetical protein